MTDIPFSGKLSNAGAISASTSTSDAEEVEGGGWWVDEVREMEGGRKG